jgi:hypothetical protein
MPGFCFLGCGIFGSAKSLISRVSTEASGEPGQCFLPNKEVRRFVPKDVAARKSRARGLSLKVTLVRRAKKNALA